MAEKMTIGVLALQGAFDEHEAMLKELAADYREIRQRKDLTDDLDGIIIPGGESTVQGKLLHDLGLFEPLRQKIIQGLPVMATCAGLILLAEEVSNDKPLLATLPVRVRRNAYGRQLGSFAADGAVAGIGDYPLRFIRAPYIEACLATEVQVLNETAGHITAVQYHNQLAMAFHPELTHDLRIHAYFLEIAAKRKKLALGA
ncbi:pyridoxal 5'-phosphate synthase glutaminase subunit PdxT [Selenomonas ruminis]|nr:pyridoxal 5'-phosphate synthase glutaminase subunit PdxT [Selenomonas sp. mPRGC5]